eukprot:scaffold7730_cov110-Isochrysis_galbana.AAC.9
MEQGEHDLHPFRTGLEHSGAIASPNLFQQHTANPCLRRLRALGRRTCQPNETAPVDAHPKNGGTGRGSQIDVCRRVRPEARALLGAPIVVPSGNFALACKLYPRVFELIFDLWGGPHVSECTS